MNHRADYTIGLFKTITRHFVNLLYCSKTYFSSYFYQVVHHHRQFFVRVVSSWSVKLKSTLVCWEVATSSY